MTALTRDLVLDQLDAVLDELVALTGERDGVYIDQTSELGRATTRALAALERLAPAKSAYLQPLVSKKRGPWIAAEARDALRALRADVEAGYVESLESLVAAQLFADFLEMADELQTKGFKDPAAVLAGSVLEEHLRKLLRKADGKPEKATGVPKKADAINAELAKVPVYNALVQKQVTAWLDLRNKAAHGNYDEYDHKQVGAFIRDVRDFMIRHAA